MRGVGVLLGVVAVALAPSRAAADCNNPEKTRIIPLPVWSTSPNSGSTWGAMPVFMRMCPDDGRTLWLLAPSITWNDTIHLTGAVRFYAYPDAVTRITLIAGASTHVNYRLAAAWEHVPDDPGDWTDEGIARLERNIFARFYGIGPDTTSSEESSFTEWRAYGSWRRGRNLFRYVNLGGTLGIERDKVIDKGVGDLPLSPEVFPAVPGMHGPSVVGWGGVDLRYDDRKGGDFAERGTRIDLSVDYVEGIERSPNFVRGAFEARTLVPELSWLTGAVRVGWMGVTKRSVPFLQQSTLGGAFLLRGFPEGRFYDRQAWTAEFEQRIRAYRRVIMGVLVDFRIDPFITVGQVFDELSDIGAHPRVAGGVGLRIFAHPNVVGRIDIADGGEGLKTYVQIGYPY